VIVADPVASGLVPRLNQPGGNITGFANWEPSMGGKWLELLSEIAPGLKRAAIMFNPDSGPYSILMPSFETAARSLKVALITAPVHSDAEIEAAIVALGREPGGGLVGMGGAFTNVHRASIISAAARNNVPAVYPQSYFVRDGGLLSYGVDPVDNSRRAATYVDRILRGRSRAISRCSCRPSSRWSSTSRPPRRSALPYPHRLCCAPPRSSNKRWLWQLLALTSNCCTAQNPVAIRGQRT